MSSRAAFVDDRPPPQYPWLEQVQAAAVGIAAAFDALSAHVARSLEAFEPTLEALKLHTRRLKTLEEAGWLPHYTTPWELLDDPISERVGFRVILDDYYGRNWPAVRCQFAARLSRYDIDAEAKATFRETLSAHGHRLYRVSVRSFFPEIDRLARAELPTVRGGPAASLQNALEELGMSEIEPSGIYAFHLLKRFETEVYASVWDEEEAAAAATFLAPSRHAALHGRVTYADRRQSINALIMADCALQVISATKRNRASAIAPRTDQP